MAKPARELQVLLHGQQVAVLRAAPELHLHYEPGVVAALGVGALCLSAALPVSALPYKDARGRPPRRAVEFWCEGLLPEGETRTMLEGLFEVRRGDTIGLLAAIGADCAGAVSFVDAAEPAPAPAAEGRPLGEDDLASAVDELPSRPLGVDHDTRVSLGGLQAKLLLTRTGQGWARPGAERPSTHILKPEPRDLRRPGLVAAEALTLRAAHLAGIEAAHADLVQIHGRLAIIVERYDRYRDDAGTIHRVHQEDGCQALGIDPTFAAKYQSVASGPPSYAGLARLLATHAASPDDELVRLGKQMVLGWAVGNTDGHARNFSILITGGAARLAPAYDVAPTRLFAASRSSGLWIDGQPELRWITRGHLVREMTAWGLLPGPAADLVDDTLAALSAALPQAAAALGTLIDEQIVEETLEHLEWAKGTSLTS